MQLISLNIWGGYLYQPLLEFVTAYRNVDIFCLQEVYHQASHKISTDERKVNLNIFSELQALLPDHQAFFKPVVNSFYGLGMLVKKNIEILDEGDIPIHINPAYSGFGPTHSRNLQWIQCRFKQQTYSVFNVHGLWNGMGKNDTVERLSQSQKIKTFIDTMNTPKILCGDFNLRPDTESIKILEKNLQNLIPLYGICSTRTSFYLKEEKYADYIFTSPEIRINSFAVLPDVVSDHAPLLLECDIIF